LKIVIRGRCFFAGIGRARTGQAGREPGGDRRLRRNRGPVSAACLARAGVGPVGDYRSRLRLKPSNLQRQSLFDEADAAESLPKASGRLQKDCGLQL